MTNQIFRQMIPKEELFKMLDSICHKNEKHYIINNSSYKRGIFKETIAEFIEYCKPYYHTSKQHYLNRKLNYKFFITIIRQICNYHNITYTSQLKYENSTYDIIYYVYY